MDITKLKKLVSENHSIRDICKEMDLSYSTIRYWLRKNDLKTNGIVEKTHWSKDVLLESIKKSNSKSDILRNIGLKLNSGNFQTLEKYCNVYDIQLENLKFDFKSHSKKNGFQRKLTNEQLFKKNNNRNNSRVIKKRIFDEKLLKNECSICGLGDVWMEKPISLQLDHKNGDRFDNTLDNLRILCPNCHSQTETFGSKNRWNYLRD